MATEVLTDSSYSVYAVERQRYRLAGTIALPVYGNVAKDNPTVPGTSASCRIVRLHAPFESLVIKWTSVREGTPPLVPNPYLIDNNYVFKGGSQSGALPMILPGYKGHCWSIAGTYEYHVVSPKNLNSDFPLGLYPWEPPKDVGGMDMVDSKIPSVYFVQLILEQVALRGGPGA